MAEAAPTACLGFCGLFGLFLLTSWGNVAPTEMALQYNTIFQTVSPHIINTAGLKFLRPWIQLLKYPRTIQTMEYTSGRTLLDGRTRDGLPLILGLSFQYRLLQDDKSLYDLYHTLENEVGDYEKVYHLVGIHIITELATNFTAYQFFNEKQRIAQIFRLEMDRYFQKHLFATVESLQIGEDDLPAAFTDSVLAAATSKQNITRMSKTRDAKQVEFQTARQVAMAQANVTVARAHGQRHRILQNGRADAAIIQAYVQAETLAYGQIKKTMGLEGDDLVRYIWYDTLSGGGVSAMNSTSNVQMLVGVDPSAYISQVRQ